MKISTKGRYALRVMVYLAEHYSEKYISIRSISEDEKISQKYLEQIVSKLSKSGLVTSARGAYGGYRLSEEPAKCNVGEILRTMEGNFLVVDCLDGDMQCLQKNNCLTHDVWSLIQLAINGVVNNLTLGDLLVLKEEKENQSELDLDKIMSSLFAKHYTTK